MNKEKILFNWSTGKDSAMSLFELFRDERYKVSLLLTTVSKAHERVSQHGVRAELLDRQAKSLDIPLRKVWLPEDLSMEKYSLILKKELSKIGREGIHKAAFGDIFLEDLRSYREARLSEAGFEGVFPLWKLDTSRLAHRFVDEGFRAIVVCVNEGYLDRTYVGREYNLDFINDLPAAVDPCGENGEFHTFVYDGPIFKEKISVKIGERVYRRITSRHDHAATGNRTEAYNCTSTGAPVKNAGLWFCDLMYVE